MRALLLCVMLFVPIFATAQSRVGNGDSMPWLDDLRAGINHLRSGQYNPDDQGILARTQEGYRRAINGIKSTDRTCRAMTQIMRSYEVNAAQLWQRITVQLQDNVLQGNNVGEESQKLLLDFRSQIPRYDQSPGRAGRLFGYNVDILSEQFPYEMQRYLSDPRGMDVCHVANPAGQLKRFVAVQGVLFQSNPRLAREAMLAFGPAVLEGAY